MFKITNNNKDYEQLRSHSPPESAAALQGDTCGWHRSGLVLFIYTLCGTADNNNVWSSIFGDDTCGKEFMFYYTILSGRCPQNHPTAGWQPQPCGRSHKKQTLRGTRSPTTDGLSHRALLSTSWSQSWVTWRQTKELWQFFRLLPTKHLKNCAKGDRLNITLIWSFGDSTV